MTWPNIKQSENTEMFKSKLRYQVTQIQLKSEDNEHRQSLILDPPRRLSSSHQPRRGRYSICAGLVQQVGAFSLNVKTECGSFAAPIRTCTIVSLFSGWTLCSWTTCRRTSAAPTAAPSGDISSPTRTCSGPSRILASPLSTASGEQLLDKLTTTMFSLLYYFRYYAQGNVSQDQYIQFIRHDTLGFEYLDQSKNFAPQVRRQEYGMVVYLQL